MDWSERLASGTQASSSSEKALSQCSRHHGGAWTLSQFSKNKTATSGNRPFCTITADQRIPPASGTVTATLPKSGRSTSGPPPADKPLHDVLAGAVARAASQTSIHPLDTLKVRMQAGRAGAGPGPGAQKAPRSSAGFDMKLALQELGSLYKGVVGAATGAGIIIGTYFAFYSTTKNCLKAHTDLSDGRVAFVAGAAAAVGSSVIKVPIAVCIRSVQANVYPNVATAARSITARAGWRGLFTGFVPTLLEDAPDMAVKMAVYESLRAVHRSLHNGQSPGILEDLVMGGVAGAAAAAATTPLDVVKTRMMCSASSRPTLTASVQAVMSEGGGIKPFFRGVGPRALSNGLNSAIFFMFFEAIRRVLMTMAENVAKPAPALACTSLSLAHATWQRTAEWNETWKSSKSIPMKHVVDAADTSGLQLGVQPCSEGSIQHAQPHNMVHSSLRPCLHGCHADGRLACLSLAIPINCCL